MMRIALIASGSVAGYLLILIVAGFLLGNCVKARVRARLAESLQADVTIADASVNLLLGKVELRGIKIVGQRGGTVDITVDRVDAGIAPLGWALVDGNPRTVAVRGVDMTLSGRGALTMRKPEARSLDIDRFELEDVRIAIMPTTLLPRLGRIDLTIDRAVTDGVALRTGVSWVFALRELVATAALPGDIAVSVGYRDQRLSLGGESLGSRPISFDFILPEVADDKFEVAQLASLAKQLAKQLVKQAAGDWFDRQIKERLRRAAD